MNLKSRIIAAFFIAVCLVLSRPAFAYDMDEVTILEQTEITKLADSALVDTYIDIIVELEAAKAFYTTSGFKPKEYTAYKNLLRYKIRLSMELQKRGLEVPTFNP